MYSNDVIPMRVGEIQLLMDSCRRAQQGADQLHNLCNHMARSFSAESRALGEVVDVFERVIDEHTEIQRQGLVQRRPPP